MTTQSSELEEFDIIELIPCESESDEEDEVNKTQDSIASSDLADSSDDDVVLIKEIQPLQVIEKTNKKNTIFSKLM